LPGVDLANQDRADTALLAAAVEAAAPIALGYFRADPQVWLKAGNSPVSEADLAVDRYLKDRLCAARPDYGWLSEETADDPSRLQRSRVFVVDPIDGTRAFLAGKKEWAISAAVVENGVPVSGALLQPATGVLLVATRGGGAFQAGVELRVAATAGLAGARVSGSKRLQDHPAFAGLGMVSVPQIPSLALRFARVAQGELDIAFAAPNAHDWDLAAADLLIREAGGTITDSTGAELVYNGAVPRHPALAGGPCRLAPAIRQLMQDILGAAKGMGR
jgi:myo-inositol-1(or 4)-monophosphatase